jgi:hypothetical protein
MIVALMCATSIVTGIEHVTTKAPRHEQVGQANLACPNLAERDKLDALPEEYLP